MARVTKADREKALERLRKVLQPGDTIFTTVKHVSSSGMSRSIDLNLILPEVRPGGAPSRKVTVVWLSRSVAAVLGYPFDDKRDAVRVSGCGMDMCFHLVYELGRALYPDGYGCIGPGCQASDHVNGDRDYTPHVSLDLAPPGHQHWHTDSGYVFHKETL